MLIYKTLIVWTLFGTGSHWVMVAVTCRVEPPAVISALICFFNAVVGWMSHWLLEGKLKGNS